MLKKTIGVAFAAAAGLMMMSGAANAQDGFPTGDWNNNVQLVPVQLCNSDIAILGVQVPVASPSATGPCINGPIQN